LPGAGPAKVIKGGEKQTLASMAEELALWGAGSGDLLPGGKIRQSSRARDLLTAEAQAG